MTHTTDVLARVPELPESMTLTTAALWAATTLIGAGLARGWSQYELRQCLLFFVARTVVDGSVTDEQLLAEFRAALASARHSDHTLR